MSKEVWEAGHRRTTHAAMSHTEMVTMHSQGLHSQLSLQHMPAISVADFAWVAATAALLLRLPGVLVPSGRYIVLGVALVVLGFGVWQWRASRTSQAARTASAR